MPVYVLRNFVFGRRQLGLSTLSGYRLDYRSVVPAVASVGFRYRLSSPPPFFFYPATSVKWIQETPNASWKAMALQDSRMHLFFDNIFLFSFDSAQLSFRKGKYYILFYYHFFMLEMFLCTRKGLQWKQSIPPPVSTPAFAARTRAWCYPWLAPLVSSQCFVSA